MHTAAAGTITMEETLGGVERLSVTMIRRTRKARVIGVVVQVGSWEVAMVLASAVVGFVVAVVGVVDVVALVDVVRTLNLA